LKFFDTHAHISLIHDDPIEQLVAAQEAKRENVLGILSITNNIRDFFTVYENLKTASNVYFAIGVSPSETANPGRDWEDLLMKGITYPRVVAIGETGLDYDKKYGSKQSQIQLFIRQLELAEMLNKPVVIHNRNASEDLLAILREKVTNRGIILHCYSEDWNFAQRALELPNLYISFSGNITYRNTKGIQETAFEMPLERMLVETESPFIVPAEFRGKRNRPSYLPSIVAFIARLRNMEMEELSAILFDNSLRVFNIQL
jgi:TatD DNase family protein